MSLSKTFLVLFYLSQLGLRSFFHYSLEVVNFSELVLAFLRFTPVSIACR